MTPDPIHASVTLLRWAPCKLKRGQGLGAATDGKEPAGFERCVVMPQLEQASAMALPLLPQIQGTGDRRDGQTTPGNNATEKMPWLQRLTLQLNALSFKVLACPKNQGAPRMRCTYPGSGLMSPIRNNGDISHSKTAFSVGDPNQIVVIRFRNAARSVVEVTPLIYKK